MTHEVVKGIEALGPKFAAFAEVNESLGKLSEDSVALLRSSGVMRLLQPKEFGGYEAHPRDFAEAVMAVARHDGAAGRVAGVVGVHPWEISQIPRVAQEVWGEDPDTWIAIYALLRAVKSEEREALEREALERESVPATS